MMKPRKTNDDLVKDAVKSLVESNDIVLDDMVGIIAGRFSTERSASFTEINDARHLINEQLTMGRPQDTVCSSQ
jgi:hypothetical protein